MNKVLVPKIAFKDMVTDEKKVEIVYARLFDVARRNILAKRQLTGSMSQKYTDVQYGRELSDYRRSSQKVTS